MQPHVICYYMTLGFSEIAVSEILGGLEYNVKDVSLYDNRASGQNHNCISAVIFSPVVHLLPFLYSFEIIHQKYMKPGHFETECGSVHSAIENHKRLHKVTLCKN